MRVEARWASIITLPLTDVRRFSTLWPFPVASRLHAHRLRALLRLHQVCHRAERTLPRAERRAAPHGHPVPTRSKVRPRLPLARFAAAGLLKSDSWLLVQIPGRRKPGNGVFGEAAHRRSAENQEEAEGGEQRQTRAVLLQVNTDSTNTDMFLDKRQEHSLFLTPSLFLFI